MNLTNRLAFLFLLGAMGALTPVSATWPAAGDDDDKVEEECGGCGFQNTPSPANPSQLPNPCGTALSVTVTGAPGTCVVAGPDCVQSLPCAASVHVQYQSGCAVTLERFSGGADADLHISGPGGTGGWVTIYGPTFQLLGCGGPANVGYFKLTDSTGFFVTNSYKFRCLPCD
jgi:hypothetical protein